MELKVSSPGLDLNQDQLEQIERDLEKLDRRLKDYELVYAELRINHTEKGMTTYKSVLELEFGKNHLVASGEHSDMGRAVREAREDILRQINDRSRRGHSDFTKRG
jgi:ribosome-associated translation inhibitor RaiA